MKWDHPVVFILTCEVYLQFICLRRHRRSVLFPFTALAMISRDRIKLYRAAACTSLFIKRCVCVCVCVCGTRRCSKLSVILLTAAVKQTGLSRSRCMLLLLCSLLHSTRAQRDVKFLSDFICTDSTAEVLLWPDIYCGVLNAVRPSWS